MNLRPQNVDQKPQNLSDSHELLEVTIKFVTGFRCLSHAIVIGNRTIDGRCWKCWVEVNDRYICICMCIACAIAMEKYRGTGGIVHMQYAEKVKEIESGKDHVVLMRDSFIVASSILHCICFSWHPIATNRTAPDSRTSGKTATATATFPNSALQVLQRPSCISTNSGESAHSIPKMRSIP